MNIFIYILANFVVIRMVLQILGLFIVYEYCRRLQKRDYKVNNNVINDLKRNDDICKKVRKSASYAVNGLIKYYMYKVSIVPCHWLRMFFYKYVFRVDVADNVVIYKGCIFVAPYKIHIDTGSVIGDDCMLDGRGGLYIGKNVNLSSKVRICTGQHSINSPDFSYVGKPVYIYDRAWVSSSTIILPGCVIGEGAVIAAGAVLTKHAPEYTFWGGVPAKHIGNRSHELTYCFMGEHDWFF